MKPLCLKKQRLLAILAAASVTICSNAQPLKLTITNLSNPPQVAIRYPSKTNGYFVLEKSTNLSQPFGPVGMALGGVGTGEFLHSTQSSSNAFFRLHRTDLPINMENLSFFDLDGDGIDDYYELTHGLMPLNPSDGPANLAAYRASLPLYAYFDTGSSSVSALSPGLLLPFYLSKSFTGTIHYQISGTSASGSDFQPLSGSVSVNGSSGSIPISLVNTPQIESVRSIVVTLQMETNKGPYIFLKPTSHRLDLIEGDNGVYAGTMGFTNGIFFGAQPLVIAVRSTGGNTGTAYFDTSGSTFFTQPFSIPILFTGPPGQFQFTGSATGNIDSTNLAHNLNWNLSLANPLFTNNLVLVPFTLTVQGVTSGSSALLAKGNIVAGLMGK